MSRCRCVPGSIDPKCRPDPPGHPFESVTPLTEKMRREIGMGPANATLRTAAVWAPTGCRFGFCDSTGRPCVFDGATHLGWTLVPA